MWDVTLPWPLLVVTHAGVAVLAGWLVYAVVTRVGDALMETTDDEETTVADDAAPRRLSATVRLAIWLLVAALVVIAIGVQSYRAQQDSDDALDAVAAQQETLDTQQADQEAYAACLTDWGNALTESVSRRAGAIKTLERAEKAVQRIADKRLRALDNIILTTVAARSIPPEATPQEFDASLRRYVGVLGELRAAKADLRDVRAQVRETRADNPYPEKPELAC